MSEVTKTVQKMATREAYGKALAEFGAKYPDLVVLDADLANATKTNSFQKVFPDRLRQHLCHVRVRTCL